MCKRRPARDRISKSTKTFSAGVRLVADIPVKRHRGELISLYMYACKQRAKFGRKLTSTARKETLSRLIVLDRTPERKREWVPQPSLVG